MSNALDDAIAHTEHERGQATKFYRWALAAVLFGVATMIGIGLYVAVEVHTINARGARNETVQVCEGNAEGTIARDVHFLIANKTNPNDAPLYVIPKLCVVPK